MPTNYGKDYDTNWSADDYNNIPKEDELNEIWRPIIIDGVDTGYMISNMGRCKSHKGNILRPKQEQNGYLRLHIYFKKDGIPIRRTCWAHRLVMDAFSINPDPKHLTQVNHKDENKKNNHLDNLERCTNRYNQNYGTKIRRQKETLKKKKSYKSSKPYPILQYSLEGCFIAEYPSQGKASKATGISQSSIGSVFCGKRRTAGGFIWVKKEGNIIPEKIDPTPYLREDMASKRIGEKRIMGNGMEAEIIEYFNVFDITVRFSDGTIVKHATYCGFKRGNIGHPSYSTNFIHAKQKALNIGWVMMNCGLKARVTDYDGKCNLAIEFEDGLKRYHISMSAFKRGKVAHKADPEPDYEPA